MPGRTILETERLWLREYVPEDAVAVFELGSDPVVHRYTGDACLTSIEQARTMLCERPIADYRQHGFGRWAVVLKGSARVVGMAGLKFLPERQEVDLGYRLLPEYWGRGLATEASRASVWYGLDTLRLPRILGLVHPANVRSIRVLMKCGMTFERMIETGSQPTAQYVIDASAARERTERADD
jgi:RimJ/RimL family protein N-acetyltransferase